MNPNGEYQSAYYQKYKPLQDIYFIPGINGRLDDMLAHSQSEHQLRDTRKSFVEGMIDNKIDTLRRTKSDYSLIASKTTMDAKRARIYEAVRGDDSTFASSSDIGSLASSINSSPRSVSSSITSYRRKPNRDMLGDVGSLSSSIDSSSGRSSTSITFTGRKPSREIKKSRRRLESYTSRRHLVVDPEPDLTDENDELPEAEREAEKRVALLDDMSAHTIWCNQITEYREPITSRNHKPMELTFSTNAWKQRRQLKSDMLQMISPSA